MLLGYIQCIVRAVWIYSYFSAKENFWEHKPWWTM